MSGLRVGVKGLALCHMVRAGVRDTVRGDAVGLHGVSDGRCSIRGACPHSREPGLHGVALGLHQIVVSGRSAILRPKSTLRPDVD